MIGLASWMLVSIGCADPDEANWTPEDGWSNTEVEQPTPLAEGLLQPNGIIRVDDGFVIAESGAGQLMHLSDSGDLTLLVDGLESPEWLADGAAGRVLVTDPGAERVLLIDGDDVVVLADGQVSPGQVASDGERGWWIERDDEVLWEADLGSGEAEIVSTLNDPEGLRLAEGRLLVTQAGSNDTLSRYHPEDGSLEDLASVEENPVGATAYGTEAFFTARSDYWPYGGWIYAVNEDGQVDALSSSPPGLDWIAADEDAVYWSSDETLARIVHGADIYEALAIRTAVGEFVLHDATIVWTDFDRGTVYRIDIP